MVRSPPAVAVVLLLVVAGCTASGDGAAGGTTAVDVVGATDNATIRPELVGDADGILLLGDSLTVGADQFGHVEQQLRQTGFEEVAIVADEGRDTLWGIEQVAEMASVPGLVVVELGTNPDADPVGFEQQVSQLVADLRAKGAERIAWLTPAHGRDDRYDDKAAILAAAVGIDVLADWATIVHDDPRRFASDGFHPTEEGYGDLAAFLVDTAATLALSR
jgi:lysophospholipase L1-like esterase